MLDALVQNFTNYRTRRITEERFNAKLPGIPDTALRRVTRRKLPTLGTSRADGEAAARVRRSREHRLGTTLESIVARLALLDEPDPRRRLDIFLGYCRLKAFAAGTVQTYYQGLRRAGLFADAAADAATGGSESSSVAGIRPDRMAFGDTGKRHVRAVSLEAFARLTSHLRANFSRYTAPLLVPVYTGLRTAEVLQWSAHTLAQLDAREHTVSIVRKNTASFSSSSGAERQTEYWRPVYYTHLCDFVRQMRELYEPECREYAERGIDTRLFPISRGVLLTRIKTEYTRANAGVVPPFGFGIHSCRNMIARVMMSSSNSLSAVQGFLQHSSRRTTRRYINADFAETTREFNRLTDEALAETRRLLPAA